MITKAYIKSVPALGDNVYTVEVPLMEDNTLSENIFNALVCSEPSNCLSYSVGDCVWVAFENDRYNNAVILGKLYVDVPTTSTTYGIFDSLTVLNSISLPPDTRIGNYTAQDIANLYQKSGDIRKDDLGDYVKWINTVEKGQPVYANKIRCMSGDLYDSEGVYNENTLYFLSSVPPSEKKNII